MADIVTQNTPTREDWLLQLADVVTDPLELLSQLRLGNHAELQDGAAARRLFPFRVPRAFIARMVPGDPHDPLLRQVLTSREEFLDAPGFCDDPLKEQHNAIPGLLHKYHNRALMLIKGGCAVNCRYCFRRHFPYQENRYDRTHWAAALDYLGRHPELNEIIFSGGDPLMAKDRELDGLISDVESIGHIRTLRIHTRLPVVIPARVTPALCRRLASSRLNIVVVTHINHANEIDGFLRQSLAQLRLAQVTLLNQSVLLRGVNDDADTLAALSEALFAAGILPYYLHLLDKVRGAAHFMVSDDEARRIMQELVTRVSGYLVPRLAREIGGERSKSLIDIGLRQH
ncbi:EF-P beta-lysylation protein EpmB [Martelella alba]|uniref:L-lysine 2,3-aminomutase n=1 Tax=Martelella alba TaxID=2590451 RepID=A0ABY2SRJ9_9HYPH|nr:EF-P beta-lysylation protein EpmB [Martelella alba]TKI08500.1 EF-P beta-lysylation protein EpmB [Martelella alba]